MTKHISCIAFVVLCVGGGFLIGTMNMPDAWYEELSKPFLNPPNWVFGAVWTILYAMLAVAGWRTWMRDANGGVIKLWFAQLAINFTWPPVFFTYHWMLLAAFIILMMIILTLLFIKVSWSVDKIAAMLTLPYLGWIMFSLFLNMSLWYMNFV